MFVFGYITCRLFYFFRSARLSLSLMRASHVIYLSALIKALEHLSHAREIMREHLIKTEKNSNYISSFEIRFNEDVKLMKKRSIDVLIACHPKFFRPMIDFDDWEEAMTYLQSHNDAALQFWNTQ